MDLELYLSGAALGAGPGAMGTLCKEMGVDLMSVKVSSQSEDGGPRKKVWPQHQSGEHESSLPSWDSAHRR